ncbi:MAG: phosphatidate cytidylyltransferase [Parasporobacterium sp.]|nr:phosphatidate cytidylyltransferase [Parasporobacterium sp.]
MLKNLLETKSFKVRLISGIVLVLILGTLVVLGYDFIFYALLALSLIGAFELFRALGLGWSYFSFVGYAGIIGHYMVLRFADFKFLGLVYVGALILVLAGFVFTFPKYSLQQVFGSFFGIFYVGVCLSFMYLLRIHPPSGAYIVWLVIFSSSVCDIFAYLTGMLFGKHKLVPKLSPKKSIEGAIGGILGSVILSFVYGLIVQPYVEDIRPTALIFPIICFFGAIVSQIGDLAASAIKRNTGIKDYGTIIPGHGGILDRFDSIIIVSPIMYLVTLTVGLF